MTRYLAVTSCSAKQWDRLGKRMAESFARHWPADVPLRVYSEDSLDVSVTRLAEYVDLHGAAPWLAPWQREHQARKGQQAGRYDYMQDAIRFSHKVAAVDAAAFNCPADVLIWLDADVVTHERVTLDWLEELFPPPAAVGWLDRVGKYPECGCVMYRLPEAAPLIERLVDVYISGKLFSLRGLTDCHALEHAVAMSGVATHSLSGDARNTAHPFVNSRLGECMDHLKGPRKEIGRSRPVDLRRPRQEEYWR